MHSSLKLMYFLGLGSTFVYSGCSSDDYVACQEAGDDSCSAKYGIGPMISLKLEGHVENIKVTAKTKILIYQKNQEIDKYLAGAVVQKNASFSLEQSVSLEQGEHEIFLQIHNGEKYVAAQKQKVKVDENKFISLENVIIDGNKDSDISIVALYAIPPLENIN